MAQARAVFSSIVLMALKCSRERSGTVSAL
jgi:hypothetical protein